MSTVFVIQGRQKAKDVGAFLSSVGLEVLDWVKAHQMTVSMGTPTPSTWEIVKAGIEYSDLVVGLLTPDDEVRLQDHLHNRGEQAFDVSVHGQARPNVLIEIGYALARKPSKTVLVQLGKHRPMTDLIGHYIIELGNTADQRRMFINALTASGAKVITDDGRWKVAGDLTIETPLRSIAISRYSGTYSGKWQVTNQAELSRLMESSNRQLLEWGAKRKRHVRLGRLDSLSGECVCSVSYDGHLSGQLVSSGAVGLIVGSVSNGGSFTGTAEYKPEPPSRLVGEVSLSGAGGVNVRLRQTLPGAPVEIIILATLNKQ